jgi:hypothetical protein
MTRHFLEQDGGGTNRSPRPRRAISFRLQAGDNSYPRFVPNPCEILGYHHGVMVRRPRDRRPDHRDPDFCAVLWRNPTRPADGHCLQEV